MHSWAEVPAMKSSSAKKRYQSGEVLSDFRRDDFASNLMTFEAYFPSNFFSTSIATGNFTSEEAPAFSVAVQILNLAADISSVWSRKNRCRIRKVGAGAPIFHVT